MHPCPSVLGNVGLGTALQMCSHWCSAEPNDQLSWPADTALSASQDAAGLLCCRSTLLAHDHFVHHHFQNLLWKVASQAVCPRVHQCIGCSSSRLGPCIFFCCTSLGSCWPNSPDCQGLPGALSLRTFSRFNDIILLSNKKWPCSDVGWMNPSVEPVGQPFFWFTACWSIHTHNSAFVTLVFSCWGVFAASVWVCRFFFLLSWLFC